MEHKAEDLVHKAEHKVVDSYNAVTHNASTDKVMNKSSDILHRAETEYKNDRAAVERRAAELKKDGKEYLDSAKDRVGQAAEDAKDQVC